MSRRVFGIVSSTIFLSSALIAGCGVGTTGSGPSLTGASISGRAMGGQQPVAGATMQLYAASTAGYGTAAIPRLTTSVTTDGNGYFKLTGLYSCPSPESQMYLVASGGNPGLSGNVNNSALVLMAALGRCGNLSSATHISLNEVTTVAAVWALAQFMPTYDHLGTSTGNIVGLTNAFTMAANLASATTGASPGSVPTGATVPSDEINTLANAVAACVNTAGGAAGDNTPCGILLTSATPSGSSAPSNTTDALLNIVRNPALNVGAIYNLSSPTAPFQPTLGSAPNDWTVAVSFPIDTRSTNNMALDASGNLLVISSDGLFTIAPSGASLTENPLMAGQTVALDATGNTWVSSASNALLKLPSGATTPVSYAANLSSGNVVVDGLALDASGNAWYTCDFCTGIYKMTSAGTYSGFFASAATSVHQTNVSIDTAGNAWLGNFDYAQVNVFQPSGAALSGSPLSCGSCGRPAYIANDGAGGAWITGNNLSHVVPGSAPVNFDTIGGLFSPVATAIDGGGNVWVVNPSGQSSASPTGSVTELTSTGTALSPALGFLSTQFSIPQSLSIDGSGNIWLRNTGSATVTALVGAGVPTVTPLALAVKTGKIGQKP